MVSANERRRYIVSSSLIAWAHTENDPYLIVIESFHFIGWLHIVFYWLYIVSLQINIKIATKRVPGITNVYVVPHSVYTTNLTKSESYL